ncbi:hypothetical protein ACHAXR_013145 [Thalassiosira sp. AJA248-18]
MDATPTLPTTLVGRVYHSISSVKSVSSSGNKKRPRPLDGCNGNDSGSINDGYHKGFIFIPDERQSSVQTSSNGIHNGQSTQPEGNGYPLIIPFQCLRAACYAAATGKQIKMSQYSLIRYRGRWGELIFSSRFKEKNNVTMDSMKLLGNDCCCDHFVAIEVHHDGLRLVSTENGDDMDKQSSQEKNAPSMTLETLAQKEAQSQQPNGSQKKKKKPNAFGKDPMNVTGVVDAISPILQNDSQEEPFAIMELYQPSIDEESTDVKSAVAVIRGENALCIHPAIHPGQSITLVGVISRKWKVPSEFQKYLDNNKAVGNRDDLYQRLNNRVPNRVVLVTEASAIRWNDECEVANSLASSRYEQDLSLPSTVESLTSIRGIVKSVHYHQSEPKWGRQSSRVVHFVTLKLLTPTDVSRDDKLSSSMNRASCVENEAAEEPKLARLYLTKYAIPPNLELGMQPGSIIRAVNIHFISPSTKAEKCYFGKHVDARYLCYVACLRSTVAVERCAGESSHYTRSSHPWFVTREKPFLLVPDHRITDICSDPLNTKSSSQYLAEENLRRELELKLGCFSSSLTESTDIEYAQRPIDDAGCHGSKSLDEKVYNPHSLKVDDLLAHHHRIVTFGKVNDERGRSKGCSCVKRKSNRVNGSENGRLTMRDPYGEFFDHAHGFSNSTECGSSCNDFSCHNHYHHPTSSSMPHVVGLEDLRNSCAHNFINRVAISFRSKFQLSDGHWHKRESSKVSSGWMSSYSYQGLGLCQVLNDYARAEATNRVPSTACYGSSNDSMNSIYTLGNIEVDNMNPGSKYATASIHDNACSIPLCETRNVAVGSDNSQAFQLESNGLPMWIQIDSVIVSCLCLGSSLKECEPKQSHSNQVESEVSYEQGSSRKVFPHTFLPRKADGADGPAFVFLVNNFIFIGSVHIVTRSSVPFDRSRGLTADAMAFSGKAKRNKSGCEMNTSRSLITNDNAISSVQDCLEQKTTDALLESPISIIGRRLVRQRFTFRKVRQSMQRERCYDGWTIILSHIDPSTDGVLDVASVLQTIEVKISVPLGKSTGVNADALKLAVHRLFSSDSKDAAEILLGDESNKIITPDQVTMGLAWCAASEDSQTSPLLSGGWDEDKSSAGMSLPPSVHIEIPFTSRTFSKLGYQRFRCNLSELKSVFVFEDRISASGRLSEIAHSASSSATPSPEFQDTVKFLPGMLNRRLRRVPPLIFNHGSGKEAPVYHCRNRHSALTWLKCKGGVPSATLAELHWDICAALKERDHSHLKPSLLRRVQNAKILGISFCRACVECTKCFQALKSDQSLNTHQADTHSYPNTNTADKKIPEKSILFCPSGCSRSYAAVKWECSAIVDDGTGQAKLYAEREGALLLLGGGLDVATIENGAWELDGGVFFQPTLPASSHLMECLKDATLKARKCIAERKLNKQEKSHNEDLPSTFSLLPADAKAEYLLHQHCRQWYQHHQNRKMDLFCRCKPLSESVTTVNQTEIQVAKAWIAKVGLDFGTAPTATLPPLKLTLEDACLASEESHDDNVTGWNLLGSFKNII